MSRLTIYLGRLLGLFTLIAAIAMLARQQAVAETIASLFADRGLLFVFGMIALATGLAIVLAHNVWSGGALPVLVTLYGWILTVRGVLLLFVSPDVLARIFEFLRFGDFFYLYATIPLVLGLYLTYASFAAGPLRSDSARA